MTTTPRVLNYKTHGLPDGAVYIGRANPHYGLKRSKWANPFVEDRHGTREEIIDHFKRWLYTTPDERSEVIARFKLPRSLHGVSVGPLINDIHELRGKDLVCWCAPAPCHGDLLLAARQCLAAPGGAVSNPLTDWMHHRSPFCRIRGSSPHEMMGGIAAQARAAARGTIQDEPSIATATGRI